MKIDIHTHILPKTWPDLSKRYGYEGFVRLEHDGTGCARMMQGQRFFRDIPECCWEPRQRIEHCDRDGVTAQVLSTVPVMFSYWAEPHDTLDLCRLLNDHIAGVVRDHPRRFIGLGTLPMQAPDLAIGELDRCLNELHLAGVEIGSHVERVPQAVGRVSPAETTVWNLNAPELFPVFEHAASIGAAVFVHPWDMMGKDVMPDYWLPWLVGMPAETARAICSMIFGGVLERLPNLRVAFAHGGGAFPGTIGRIDHGFRVRPDLCAKDNPHSPRNYLGKFYVDSLVHDEAALRLLIELIGPNRICLGADYPFPLGEHKPGHLIESLEGISPEDKHKMLATTPLEFLNLPAQRFQ